MKFTKIATIITKILLIVAGINWGLFVFNINLISALLGASILAKIVYGIIGVAGLYGIYALFK